MKKLLFPIFLLFFSMKCFSSTWETIVTMPDQKGYQEIDSSSIAKDGNLIKVWTKATYLDGYYDQQTFYKSSKILYKINCQSMMISYSQAIYYSEIGGMGKVVKSYSISSPVFDDIAPETLGEIIAIRVCKKK